MSDTDLVTLDRGNGTSCRIHSFGATVISWKCKKMKNIFLSAQRPYLTRRRQSAPTSGHGKVDPSMGFARITMWQLTQSPIKDTAGNVTATFLLEDNEETREMWNYKFKLTYKVTLLENALQMEFAVENIGKEELAFTCLLHTYFQVPDIRQVTVSSLKGATYLDKVKNEAKEVEQRDLVTFQENVDRVYIDTPMEHAIGNAAGGRTILLQKSNLSDTVVWNPWQEKAAAMSDLGDDDYLSMVCVEAGAVATPQKLGPSQSFRAGQTFLLAA
ncbi:hypothetical protein LSAT2_023176 [Lamellibrachia satsuma]|nr:hypothetical protein LSAT2_023176 [Lamellibrachia satsuma]